MEGRKERGIRGEEGVKEGVRKAGGDRKGE